MNTSQYASCYIVMFNRLATTIFTVPGQRRVVPDSGFGSAKRLVARFTFLEKYLVDLFSFIFFLECRSTGYFAMAGRKVGFKGRRLASSRLGTLVGTL